MFCVLSNLCFFWYRSVWNEFEDFWYLLSLEFLLGSIFQYNSYLIVLFLVWLVFVTFGFILSYFTTFFFIFVFDSYFLWDQSLVYEFLISLSSVKLYLLYNTITVLYLKFTFLCVLNFYSSTFLFYELCSIFFSISPT